MKKAFVITTLAATVFLNSNFVYADANKEENIGFASGAISGGLIAGPIGLIVGATIGALLGNGAKTSDELKTTKLELTQLNLKEESIQQELIKLQKENDIYVSELKSNNEFQTNLMTEGLTLNVMFTSGSANLLDNDILNIAQVSKILSKFPLLKIKLDGYTDPVGSAAENLLLSQNRVKSVTTVFNQYGVDTNRLITRAHGEAEGYKIEDGAEAFAMARKVSLSFIADSPSHVAQN